MSGPIQYRNGYVDFCGLRFTVDSRALIPRFETEFLVKKTVDWSQANRPYGLTVADIGTGSGSVAISIAAKIPNIKVIAVDISPEALSLAKENAVKQKVTDRISFVLGDLLLPVSVHPDVIVANLPYIPTSRIAYLDSDVRDFEPHLALDGGRDGFDLYRRLLNQISQLPQLPRLCIFEIDNDQGKIAIHEVRQRLPGAAVQILKDSSGLVRYAILEFNNN